MRVMRDRRRLAAWGAGLVLLALFWGGLWHGLDRSILTRVPVLDEAYYLREGAAIQGGRLLPDQPAVMSPLYPWLVAATGSGREIDPDGVRSGPPPTGVRILQAVLWLGIVLMLYRAARRLLPGRWAGVPPLLFALYRPAAVFVTTPLLEIPLAFTVTLVLYLLPGPAAMPGPARAERPGSRRAVLLGALIGAATLLRGVALVLIVPAALALRSPASTPGRRRTSVRPLLALAGTVLVVLAPAIVSNSILSGRLVGPTLNGGQNFYIGQGKDANGFFRTFAGFDFEHDPAGVAFLSGRIGRRLAGPAEADALWRSEALAWGRDNPVRSVGLWLKKIWLHFVGVEIDQVTPLAAWTRDAPLLRGLPVPWAVIAAGGLAGLLLRGRERAWRLWALAIVLYVAAQSLFFVVSRYRLALVPALCLFAGGWGAEVARRSGRARLVAAGVGVAAALVIWPGGLGAARDTWRATGLANEARRWARAATAPDLARAEQLYREAVAADPTQSLAWQGLARVLLAEGRQDEAEGVLADGALRALPPGLLDRDLITLMLRDGRSEAALPRLVQYLRDRPADREMQHALIVALGQAGRPEQAIEAARRFVATAPDDPQGYVDLGVLLARNGRRDEAREVFARGLQRRPSDPNLRHNLELLGPAPAAPPPR
ncbi:MAG: ArnT family glycosyltransferase [Candidatus Krumholzibacteriia bacterium]